MYRARALKIVDRMPVLGLGTDIVTRFPGETGEDHRATVELVEAVRDWRGRDREFSKDEVIRIAQRLARELMG